MDSWLASSANPGEIPNVFFFLSGIPENLSKHFFVSVHSEKEKSSKQYIHLRYLENSLK